MTLTDIWQIIRRRWLYIAIPTLLALIATLAFNFSSVGRQQRQYAQQREIRFIVGQTPGDLAKESEYERYHAWVQSEYIAGSLVDWVNGTEFASRIGELLAKNHGIEMDADKILPIYFANRARSQVLLGVVDHESGLIDAISESITEIMLSDLTGVLPPLGEEAPSVSLVDYSEIESAEDIPVANQLESNQISSPGI